MNDKSRVASAVALLIVVVFCIVLVALLFHVVPPANSSAFNGLVTALVSMVSGVIGYYFGSSRTTEQHVADLRAAAKLSVTTPRPLDPKN